jgi:hypothetical protein
MAKKNAADIQRTATTINVPRIAIIIRFLSRIPLMTRRMRLIEVENDTVLLIIIPIYAIRFELSYSNTAVPALPLQNGAVPV